MIGTGASLKVVTNGEGTDDAFESFLRALFLTKSFIVDGARVMFIRLTCTEATPANHKLLQIKKVPLTQLLLLPLRTCGLWPNYDLLWQDFARKDCI